MQVVPHYLYACANLIRLHHMQMPIISPYEYKRNSLHTTLTYAQAFSISFLLFPFFRQSAYAHELRSCELSFHRKRARTDGKALPVWERLFPPFLLPTVRIIKGVFQHPSFFFIL